MSESSSTFDSVFQAPRDIVNRTIDAQESINSQGLDVTRKAVKPLAGAVPRTDSAEEQVDDAFDQLDETQTELLDRVHGVADRTIDTSEDAAEWGYDVLDRQVGRFQQAREEAEETAGEALETAEDTADDVADSAEEAADDVADSAEDTVSELQGQVEEVTGEFDAVDETVFEDLADDGFETLSDLASAQADAVANAADATTEEAEQWIDAAIEYEGESLADLDGIGRTYSDRLADAGVRTVDQLARTSSEEVAETAGVDEERAAEWVQQAQDAS